MAITLPKTPTPITAIDPRLLVFYGQRKIGKTTILSQLDNCLILETDLEGKGADFTNSLRVPIPDYDTFIEVTTEIIKEGKPYKYVALDTVTTFLDYCEVNATQVYKRSNAGKNFNGRSVLELTGPDFNPGYQWLRNSFSVGMDRLLKCAERVIVMAHIADKMVKVSPEDKGKSSSEVSVKELDLPGKCRTMLSNAADAIGFLYRTYSQDPNTPQKLWVDFRTKDFVNAGTRATHLVQKNFVFDWNEIYIEHKQQETTKQ